MIDAFMDAVKMAFEYELKDGTATSYYHQNGPSVLPNRMSISRGHELRETQRKGRNLDHEVIGQMKGSFTIREASPLKRFKPYNIHTNIYRIPDYPMLGYGSIGITNDAGKIEDSGDLVIVTPMDGGWHRLKIFLFRGMAKRNMIENLLRAMSVVSDSMRQIR